MKLKLRKIIAASAALAGLSILPAAHALDVNGDGRHDFRLREMPYLSGSNVGSNCDHWQNGGPQHGRLYVRPPRIWGLPRIGGRQKVGWRARFYDAVTGKVVASGRWKYSYALPYLESPLGAGPDAGNGVYITQNQYWAGSQYYDHLSSDGAQIRAIVDAAWYNARKRTWTVKALRVQWVIATINRSTGQGQTMISTPIKNASC
jgi:hypothetical protein